MAIKKNYQIKKREAEDSLEFYNFITKLDNEAKYMMYDKDERETSPEEIAELIMAMDESEMSSFIALDKNKIVGYIVAIRELLNRNRHCASFMMGVLPFYQKQGLGNKLIKEIEAWARENEINRLEATVIDENLPAIKLLEKRGYELEGTKKNSIIIDDEYYNELIYAKILE